MIIASTLSTIEAVIPYLILAGGVVFIVLRLVGVPLASLWHVRKRKNEQSE